MADRAVDGEGSKRCTKCGETKPLGEFGERPSGRPQSCVSSVPAGVGSERLPRRSAARPGAPLRRLWRGADPRVLDFDDVRGVKRREVGRMASAPVGEAVLRAEIAKCEVRCVNCHRRRTRDPPLVAGTLTTRRSDG